MVSHEGGSRCGHGFNVGTVISPAICMNVTPEAETDDNNDDDNQNDYDNQQTQHMGFCKE